MYNHNVYILAKQLIPPILRNSRMVAWIELLVYPLKRLWTIVLDYYARIDRLVAYNGQVIYLQEAIRSVIQCNVIIIDNTNRHNQLYIYKIEDNLTSYIYTIGQANNPLYDNIYLYRSNDYLYETDYIVKIENYNPQTINLTKEVINLYNPTGRHYQIQQLWQE